LLIGQWNCAAEFCAELRKYGVPLAFDIINRFSEKFLIGNITPDGSGAVNNHNQLFKICS